MLFNYNTLNVTLDKETRSIHILLNRPDLDHSINVEMLFELESLFGWLSSHLEVNAVCLSSTKGIFCSGFDQSELKIMSREKLHKYLTRFQKLITGIQHLPQTIICDLKEGASGMGIELAMACDIRIAKKTCEITFNSLQKGWVPCAGGVSSLAQLVGLSQAKQWVLSSAQINAERLFYAGFLLDFYNDKQDLGSKILEKISTQAPVTRIQTKRSFLEFSSPEWERGQEYEFAFALAALESGDWKKTPSEEFTSAREMAEKIKKNKRFRPDLNF